MKSELLPVQTKLPAVPGNNELEAKFGTTEANRRYLARLADPIFTPEKVQELCVRAVEIEIDQTTDGMSVAELVKTACSITEIPCTLIACPSGNQIAQLSEDFLGETELPCLIPVRCGEERSSVVWENKPGNAKTIRLCAPSIPFHGTVFVMIPIASEHT